VSGARIAVLPDRLNNYILFRGIVKDFLRKRARNPANQIPEYFVHETFVIFFSV
jgi:hypothetical protein